MHSRCVSLSFPAIRPPATLPAGTPRVRPRAPIAGRVGLEGREPGTCGRTPHPGARASRPVERRLRCEGRPSRFAENTAEETPHPGARASRPHALPQRTAQNACDGAPANPAGRNGVNPAKAEPWRDCRSSRVGEEGQAVPGTLRKRRPPGSAGVSPACTAAAYRTEPLRRCTRQPRRQKRREPGQSRALA